MRQHDPKLIIQAVEERLELPAPSSTRRPHGRRSTGQSHAGDPGAALESDSSGTPAREPRQRHSVSAKIRMDPPAVRTYSTLPAEIQL